MSLLRTVMDVQSQIVDSSSKGKTILLFVVRDYVGDTPKGSLSKVLLDDMARIWQSIKRHADGTQSDISDHFELRFCFLPHKVLQPEKFTEALSELRGDFVESQSPTYLFPPSSRDTVSCKDFAIYIAGIWERIKSNKDLDLPTERELLAQYRCDEIIHVSNKWATSCVNNAFPSYRPLSSNSSRPSSRIKNRSNVASLSRTWVASLILSFPQSKVSAMPTGSKLIQCHVIDLFLAETARYPTGIVERKQEELKSKVVLCVHDLVSRQVENHQTKAVELLHRLCEVNEGLPMIERLENAYTESWEFFFAGLEGIPL